MSDYNEPMIQCTCGFCGTQYELPYNAGYEGGIETTICSDCYFKIEHSIEEESNQLPSWINREYISDDDLPL